MIASVALSMALAPLLLLFVQKIILPRTGTLKSDEDERPHDVENDHARILLAGFGALATRSFDSYAAPEKSQPSWRETAITSTSFGKSA
jgi:hypothetical protein